MKHISRYDDMHYVDIPKLGTKTNKRNAFAITGPLLEIIRNYERLRPANATTDRFFFELPKWQMHETTNREEQILQNASPYCNISQFA